MPRLSHSNLTSTGDKESILTVSGLNKLARTLLESNFAAIAVEGEISNLATPASGHWYLTLKDKNSQLRCAMFRGRNRLLGFKPRNGLQVVIRGKLSIYEGRGDYQLIAESMEEAGDGALRRAFEELKAKLHAEGLFEEESKREIGTDYRHIGIITSATGAAIRDIVSVFKRRFPAIQLTLFPVAVQGSEAPGEIVKAIELANVLQGKLGLEALIVGRGGGSLEDLQAFNEESVARAVFGSELPVTSAVGHEIDFSICDFVADLRAPTPSAAAEMMSPDQRDYAEYIESNRQLLAQAMQIRLREEAKSLLYMSRQLKRPDRRLQEYAQTFDRLEQQMQRSVKNHIATKSNAVSQLRRAIHVASPLAKVKRQQHDLRLNLQRFKQAVNSKIQNSSGILTELARSLNAVSPLQVLARGYSITYNTSGQLINSSDKVRPGEQIVSKLADGTITSKVEDVESDIKPQ